MLSGQGLIDPCPLFDDDGKYWFPHFEDRHAWGRVVHLQPMSWTADGCCIIGQDIDGDGIGEPVSLGAKTGFFATSDIKKNDGGSVEIY